MVTRLSDIKHDKQEVNAEGEVLGRLATKIANLLMGKNKPYFVRHLDCGDFVTVTNAAKVKVTGKKEELKKYTHYSGYPGGLRTKTLKMVRQEKPEQIIHHAVSGMLPNNKLKKFWLARFKINA
ncbi:MAG: 50S ribosomal protein L13 [Patescibacteria group bacterium]|nr:50S ribosomal protein L13 [Patescibacteria group bacterium]MCL5431769.1 50S ribosomal protein L13 [Patescibacteria group bacterium]